MELQTHLQYYFEQLSEELKISPVPQMRMIDSPLRHCSGDFSIYMNHPSAEPLKPHIQRLLSDIPRVSGFWPLQISRVELKPESPYLELYLARPRAFQYLCQNIAELHSSIAVCESTEIGKKRLLLVNAPNQNEFDEKKSSFLVNYMRRLSRLNGFECTVYEEYENLDGDRGVEKDELKNNPYYDETRECLDLPKFIGDRQLTSKFDSSIGVLHETNPALKYALVLQRYLTTNPEKIICHVVPQSRSVSQQQIGLVLLVLGCQVKQSFVIHGGADGGSFSIGEHEENIGIYISNQLRQKQVPGNEHVGEILKRTKLVFDFLGIKQQSRMKCPNTVQDGSDSNSFEGKGGLFVQYTCSRLTGLLRKYDRIISQGAYPGCTTSDELSGEKSNWALLSSDQEWDLCKTMMRFLDLLRTLKNVVPEEDPVSRIDVKANGVCEGLLNVCKGFSIFYSKVRILVEGQGHIFPAIESRIYFAKMLLDLVTCGLWLLGLNPVECM